MATSIQLNPKQAASLYRKHVIGAWWRCAFATVIYVYLIIGFLAGTYSLEAFKGMTVIGLIITLYNPPTLLILKRIRNKRIYEYFSLFISFVESSCLAGIIYLAGGMHANVLLLIFAAQIAYVGVAAPRRFTFFVAMMAVLEYNLVIYLEHFGILPHQSTNYYFEFKDVLIAGIATVPMLGTVTASAIFTGAVLRENRDKLRMRNHELDQLNKIASLANQSLDLRDILNKMVQQLIEIFPVHIAAISLVAPSLKNLCNKFEIQFLRSCLIPYHASLTTFNPAAEPQPSATVLSPERSK